MNDDQRGLIQIDARLLIAETREPADRGAVEPLRFPIAHEQGESERVGKRQLRKARRSARRSSPRRRGCPPVLGL
jgi:hypothetical protein